MGKNKVLYHVFIEFKRKKKKSMSINPSLGRAKLKRHSICFSWRRNFSPIVCCNPFVLRKGCKINTKVSRFNMSMAAPTIYFRPRLR